MNIYVPYQSAESEFVEKKSRFVGHLCRVDTEAEAFDYINRIKTQYNDARHNTFCYKINDAIVRYSDDGEPQGTAGQPMLKVFEKENVSKFCCVVTRYFGGILLGTGGLSRAYAKSAKDTLIVSGLAQLMNYIEIELLCDYSLYDKFKFEIDRNDGQIIKTDYSDIIHICVQIEENKLDVLIARLTDLSFGKIKCTIKNKSQLPGIRMEIK